MAEVEGGRSALQDSVVRAWAWRMATAGNSPEKIADEINARFGKGQPITDVGRIAENLAKERAYRNSPVPTPEEAVRRLIDMVELLQGELAIARVNFETQPQDHGRGGALIALTAVCDFIERFQDMDGERLAFPLRALMFGLIELDNGVVHPMLEREKPDGRPSAPQAWKTLVGFAVTAMEAAMHEGVPRKQAAALVAADLHRRGYRQSADGRAIAAATVANWRSRAMEGPGGFYDDPHARLQVVRDEAKKGRKVAPGAWRRILDALDGWGRTVGLRRIPPS